MHHVRVQLVRESRGKGGGSAEQAIHEPNAAYEAVKDLETRDREVFAVLYLDARHHLIGREEVSVGTLHASLVHPREVFKGAILASASAIIVSHNHPSGDPEPSSEDLAVTRRLIDAGNLLGIPLLDHIVVGHRSFISLRERRGGADLLWDTSGACRKGETKECKEGGTHAA